MKDKQLRKKLPTKEDRWWRDGDFKEDEYRLGLDSLVDHYRELGYLDASVQGEKITYTDDKKWMDIRINVTEGKRYRFGNATFIHNNIVEDAALKAQVLLDSGEIFNMKKYEATKFQVQSVYREEGYLFMDMQDQFTYRDSVVDVTFTIKENNIAHIHLVDIRGNTKTKDKVIRREVKLFPGDIFRQSLIMRAQRDIMQLAFFDNVEPNIEQVKDGDASDVNLVLKVTEKQAGTGTVSAGLAYSQRDTFVGTVGLQIPNFMGNGQRADLSLEYGEQKQLASIGFTEPWFLDTPTLVGGSIFYSFQRRLAGHRQRLHPLRPAPQPGPPPHLARRLLHRQQQLQPHPERQRLHQQSQFPDRPLGPGVVRAPDPDPRRQEPALLPFGRFAVPPDLQPRGRPVGRRLRLPPGGEQGELVVPDHRQAGAGRLHRVRHAAGRQHPELRPVPDGRRAGLPGQDARLRPRQHRQRPHRPQLSSPSSPSSPIPWSRTPSTCSVSSMWATCSATFPKYDPQPGQHLQPHRQERRSRIPGRKSTFPTCAAMSASASAWSFPWWRPSAWASTSAGRWTTWRPTRATGDKDRATRPSVNFVIEQGF